MIRSDLPPDLLAANPVASTPSDEPTRLAAVRTVVDSRRHAEATSTIVVRREARRPRRWVAIGALTAAAVTTPITLTVVGPQLWTTMTGRPPETAPLIDAAIAADGSLKCGGDGGFAAPIRPDQAKVRMWPTALPSGWKVTDIFARSITSTAACRTSSLVAASTGGDGTVTGRVSVIGPAHGISTDGGAQKSDDTIDGRKASRFHGSRPDTYSWLWTDKQDRQWYATVTGYPLERAKAVMTAVGTRGDQVTWQAGVTPDLRVLHQRSGPPYPRQTRTESWYIRLTDGHQQRDIMVDSNRDHARPLASAAEVGMQIRQESGHTELLSGFGPTDGADTDRVAYEPEPGVRAYAEVYGDLDDVRTILVSLRNVAADDNRLGPFNHIHD